MTSDLSQDIASVTEGWSAEPYVISRAICIRSHAKSGNHQRVEELAIEIEALQLAEAENARLYSPRTVPCGRIEWSICAAKWAAHLIQGYGIPRTFSVEVDASDIAALAQAQKVFRQTQLTPLIETADIIQPSRAARTFAHYGTKAA